MKKLIFTAVIVLYFSISGSGQEIKDYQYVRVPEKFDFLQEENQYQLNALTAFLFEKFGFTALYKEPLPKGVSHCDILDANVHKDSGLLRSKLSVTLKNCDEEVVFTSKTGTSRKKKFKDSYQEALRDAFESIEALNHTMTGEVIIDPVVSAEERKEFSEPSEVDSLPAEVIVDPVITSKEREELRPSANTYKEEILAGRFQNGGAFYELRKTSVGFALFKAGKSEPFARLIKSGNADNFLYSSEAVSGIAFFDAAGNLIIEFVDSQSGQVFSVIYRKD